ncbi:MAG: FHA domain-containing protein [Anaerolineae bacterium]
MRLALRWSEDDEEIILPIPEEGVVSIGRGDDCDVVLSDATVSRQHAEIYTRDGVTYIRHISATNPTYLNGEIMVGEKRLNLGDELWFPVRLVHVTAINWPSMHERRTSPSP